MAYEDEEEGCYYCGAGLYMDGTCSNVNCSEYEAPRCDEFDGAEYCGCGMRVIDSGLCPLCGTPWGLPGGL